MYLYIVRHGEARTKEEDPSRSLTGQGIEQITQLGKFIVDQPHHITQILHSGITRAQQTAQILKETLKVNFDIELEPSLDPSISVEGLAHKVQSLPHSTMLVGHLPFVELLAYRLLKSALPDKPIVFEPGTCYCLTRAQNGDWRVVWNHTAPPQE